jgi:hypothetical protein
MHIEPHNIQPLLDRYKEAGIKSELWKEGKRIYFPEYVWQTELGELKAYLDLNDPATISLQKKKNKDYFNTAWKPIIAQHYKEVEHLYKYVVTPTTLVTLF